MNEINPKNKKDKLDSFDNTKKWILDKIWNWMPRWLRIFIVIIVIIATPLISTQSYWFPYIKDIFIKPVSRHTFRGYIYSENNTPLETTVVLIDDGNVKITEEDSDVRGFITFNIPEDKTIRAFRILVKEDWKEYLVKDQELKSNTKFKINISEGRIEWQKN